MPCYVTWNWLFYCVLDVYRYLYLYCRCAAGFPVLLLANPFDVWRTRLQTNYSTASMTTTGKQAGVSTSASTRMTPISTTTCPNDTRTNSPRTSVLRTLFTDGNGRSSTIVQKMMRGIEMSFVRHIFGNGIYFTTYEAMMVYTRGQMPDEVYCALYLCL